MIPLKSVSYKQLFRLSVPIMIGSAVQNSIALSDSAFLLYYDQTDFAAIGLVSVFYLIVSAIGYGFSKGSQILVARKLGQTGEKGMGHLLGQILMFQIILGVAMLLLLYLGAKSFLGWFIDIPVLLDKSWEYLSWRSWSILFSYAGLGFISFYTGISRTMFIVYDVAILLIVNLLLNYVFIFGAWGMPEMGIGGAGLASAIAEVVAFLAFLLYVLLDKKRKLWGWRWRFIPDKTQLSSMWRVGFPVVVQMIVSLGSWFVFFSFIESYGERALAISNLSRIAYLFFSIPCWGYSSGINTVASFLIGQNASASVMPAIRKTVVIATITTMVLALPVLIAPSITLQWLNLGPTMALISDAEPILQMVLLILLVFCIGGIYYNGLVGTGDTLVGLYIQTFGVIAYIIYLFVIIKILELPLIFAWTGEIFFWLIIIGLTTLYLRSGKWQHVKI